MAKTIEDLPYSCKEALDLATLIGDTGQIEDLLGVEGEEDDLRSIASRLPLPTGIPRFAERVDEFKSTLSKVSKQTSDKALFELLKNTVEIRDEATKYIGAALTRCVVMKEIM